MKEQNKFLIISACLIVLFNCCDNSSLDLPPVITTSSSNYQRVVFDQGHVCTTKGVPFFSCFYNSSLPNGEAEIYKEDVEVSFGDLEGHAALVSPGDRILFSLLVYPNPLYSTFVETAITKAQFDTLKTDCLFQGMRTGQYYLNVAGNMNCIFFQSVNGNYGVMKINSVMGDSFEGFTVNFDVKYIEHPQ